MSFNSNTPIYLQVIESIKKELVLGILKPGDKLPSTRELAIQYNINPNTAARVYNEMELSQLCFTKRGLGTFVTESIETISSIKSDMANQLITHFVDEMTELGYSDNELIQLIELRRRKK
jgi:GntR family transcriptional regulator